MRTPPAVAVADCVLEPLKADSTEVTTMRTRWLHLMLVAVFSLAGASVLAQTVYKSTMRDGKVVYGESPAPGAVKVETMKPPPRNAGVRPLTSDEAARLQTQTQEAQEKKAAAVGTGSQDYGEAQKALRDAESALEAGREPLPGERIGTAGGKSRLNEDYFARQRQLEQAVEEARARLEALKQAGAR